MTYKRKNMDNTPDDPGYKTLQKKKHLEQSSSTGTSSNGQDVQVASVRVTHGTMPDFMAMRTLADFAAKTNAIVGQPLQANPSSGNSVVEGLRPLPPSQLAIPPALLNFNAPRLDSATGNRDFSDQTGSSTETTPARGTAENPQGSSTNPGSGGIGINHGAVRALFSELPQNVPGGYTAYILDTSSDGSGNAPPRLQHFNQSEQHMQRLTGLERIACLKSQLEEAVDEEIMRIIKVATPNFKKRMQD